MKVKGLKIFLILVTCFCFFVLAGCTDENVEVIYVKRVDVVEESIPVGYEVSEIRDSGYSVIKVNITYSNEKVSEVGLSASMLTETDIAKFGKAGKHTITVNYENKVDTFNIRIFEDNSIHFIVNYHYYDETIETVAYAYNEYLEEPVADDSVSTIFLGWFTDAAFQNKWDFNSTRITSGLDLYEGYEVHYQTITYMSFGEKVEDKEYVCGKPVELIDIEAEGYTFVGWTLDGEEITSLTMPVAAITLVAKWSVNSYVVTFDTLTSTVIDNQTVNYNEQISAPADPVLEGYAFVGWTVDGQLIDLTTFKMPANNINLVAQYDINSYYATFVNEGQADERQVVKYDASITPSVAVEKEGHTFVGWTVDGNVIDFTTYKMPANNVTFVAQYDINSYTVTFDIEGETSSQVYDYASMIEFPEIPEKEGHSILGWTVNDQVIDPDTYTVPANNITFVAKYVANDYLMTFDIEGNISNKECEFNKTIEFPEIPEIEGYTVVGWTVDEQPIDPATYLVPAHPVTFVAVYQINTYTLTYVINGETVETVEATYNTVVDLPTIPESLGLTIIGWSVDGVGIGTSTYTVPSRNVTIIAVYSSNIYDLIFDVDGQTTTIQGEFATSVDLLTIPEKVGHTVVGWSVDGNLVEGNTYTVPAASVTFVAVYEKIIYTLTIEIDGVQKEEKHPGETTVQLPTDPTCFGHNFSSWSVDGVVVTTGSTYEMPYSDITIVANFTEYDYSYLTYEINGGEVYITGLNKNVDLVYLPSYMTIDNTEYPVTKVSTKAFEYRSIKTVLISDNIKALEINAFNGCSSLTTVEIEENSKLISIGQYAFDSCTSLTTIVLPNGLKQIDAFAFRGCLELTEITIPNTVTIIGNNAFDLCMDLVITVENGANTANWAATWNASVKQVIYRKE